jgi:hypothetical protein
MVRNTGSETLRNLTVTLKNDQRAKELDSQPVDQIAPGETRTVSLTSRFERIGLTTLTAHVGSDDLEADNTVQQVIAVRDQVRVLIVDGAPNEELPERSSSFRVGHALVPIADKAEIDRFPIRVYTVPPRMADKTLLSAYDVCILVNCALAPLKDETRPGGQTLAPEFVNELGEFVRHGNGLIIFAGDNVVAPTYNRVLGTQLGLLPATLTGRQIYPDEQARRIDRKTFSGAAFLRFSEEDFYKSLDDVKIKQTLTVRDPVKKDTKKGEEDATRVVVRYNDGTPAMLGRKVGAGEVLFIATSADPGTDPKVFGSTWNDLSWWGGFLPLMQSCLTHMLDRQTQKHNYTAGEVIRWQPDADDAEAAFVLVPPAGAGGKARPAIRLGRAKEDAESKPALETPVVERAGVYYLTRADRENAAEDKVEFAKGRGRLKLQRVPFAVVPDPSEAANLDTMSNEELDRHLGLQARHVLAGDSASSLRVDAGALDWTVWLLVFVLVVTVGESVLAWLCGRAW